MFFILLKRGDNLIKYLPKTMRPVSLGMQLDLFPSTFERFGSFTNKKTEI